MSLTAIKEHYLGFWEPYLAFRAARVMFLLFIIILPWEAVTSLREICLVSSMAFVVSYYILARDTEIRLTPLFWPLLIYTACAALSLLSAVSFEYSLRELRAEVLKGLIVFYTAVHYVKEKDHLSQAWYTLLIGVGLMVVLGIWLFFSEGGSLFSMAKRAGSLHGGYGGLASYLSLVWPFVLLAPLALDSSKMRGFFWGLIPLTAFLAYLTYSRAAWAALVIETGLAILAFSKKRLKMAAVVLVVVVLAGGLLLALPGSRHGEKWAKLMENPEEVGGTAGDLAALWTHSYNHLKKQPFTGIGLGRHSFDHAFPEFRKTHQPLLWHSHNVFVETALQLGVQGLLAILLIVVVLLAVLWPKAPPRRGDMPALFKTAACISVAGFFLRNLTDDFFVNDSALLFWLICGLALGVRALHQQRKQPAS